MGGADYWQQQQLEHERMWALLTILQKVARGQTTQQDALYLASELGLTTEYHKEVEHEIQG